MMKPEPKPTAVVCSVCGLDWELHKPGLKRAPTLETCLKLLKAELAARPQRWAGITSSGITYGQPLTNLRIN